MENALKALAKSSALNDVLVHALVDRLLDDAEVSAELPRTEGAESSIAL